MSNPMSGGGMAGWSMLRSMRNRDEVSEPPAQAAAPPGASSRFAQPYRRDIIVFLVTVVLAAVIGVATPVLAGDVINAITGGGAEAGGIVVRLALVIAGLAVVDALLSLAQRWYSARIGEGIILDLRTRVYDHVQRMPLQFFTRTQTGALVSRLNNDVLGAQRAFTSTLSGVVSNVIQLVLTAAVMFTLSWQITVLSLVLLPMFIIPARRVGKRLAEITRESYNLDAKMNATMTERFGVAGALLVKLFGRPDDRGRAGSASGPSGSATSASSRRCTRARSSWRCCWSPRWRRRSPTGWAAGSRSPAASAPAPWSRSRCCSPACTARSPRCPTSGST